MQFSVLQPRAKQNMSCSYCAISAKFFPASCLGVLSPSVEALYSGSSSRMTNSRVFWLVHGIKQRVGHGSTSPTAQAGFGKLGGTSECVGFFQCCCAGMQGRAACSGVGLQPVCLSVWGFPHLGGGPGGSSKCGTSAGVLGRDPHTGYSAKVLWSQQASDSGWFPIPCTYYCTKLSCLWLNSLL